MRLKKVKGAFEAVWDSPYCIKSPESKKGHWQSFFGNKNPLHIEIGMGKGQFLFTLAKKRPDINYIGIERYESVLIRAVQKMDMEPLPNLRFLCMDAGEICDVFAPAEIGCIYLNFSDPWPKDRHAKRRLTSEAFLKRYDTLLTPDGRIEFKTDNRALFDFSLESMKSFGFQILTCTYDLHHDGILSQGNILTEYEQKFSAMGNPICKLTACR